MHDDLNPETQQYEQPVQPEPEKVAAPEVPAEQPAPKADDQREYNFRLIRERAEAAERRAQELERLIQANMAPQQQPQKPLEEDDDLGISDDSYVEAKQLKKYVKSIKQELKETKQKFEEYHKKNSLDQAEVRLKSQFTDFDAVVTQENLEKLAATKPALYRSIMANSDIYDRGYTAYELLKNSGMSDKNYERQDKRLEDNKAKPRSASNVAPQSGDTPLTRVGDYDRRVLTEARKEELRRSVEEAKKLR